MTRSKFTPRIYERYPRPSFANGFARALDLFGRGFRSPLPNKPGHEIDAEAIASDWAAIGGDLRKAMERAGAK
jgi:hypothetical protein